jgi:hypothetical protein
MSAPIHRSLAVESFTALKAEVLRAAVELSDEQLSDMTESLHAMVRLRRPGRPIAHPEGWLAEEPRNFA